MKDRFIHPQLIAICDEKYDDLKFYYKPILNDLLVLHHIDFIDPLSYHRIKIIPLVIADSNGYQELISVSSARSDRPSVWHTFRASQLRNFRQFNPCNRGYKGGKVEFVFGDVLNQL